MGAQLQPKPIAKMMLNIAVGHTRDALRPWTLADTDADYLIEQFTGDFNAIFDASTQPDTFTLWAERIKRLFTSVGAAASLFAESRQLGVKDPPGDVGAEDLRFAVKLVEVAICPVFPPGSARACKLVPDLQDRDLERKLVVHVRQIYDRYLKSKNYPPLP